MTSDGPAITGAQALSPRHEMRVLAGFVAQPIVALLFGFVTFPIVEVTGRPFYGGYTPDKMVGAVAFGLGTAFLGLMIAIFVALPLFVWLRRRGPITRTKTFVSGALLGNLPMITILVIAALRSATDGTEFSPVALTYGTLGAIRAIAFGTAAGLTCAAVFWWIAGRHLEAP